MASEERYGVPDDENPEWTEEQMRTARTASEVFPPAIVQAMQRRGPQKAPTKRMVSLRLDAEVLERFRATGRGWQSRINQILTTHAPRRRRARKVARP